MYNIYSGKTVRLRPWVSLDEYKALALEQGLELNPHWGSWFWPLDHFNKDWPGTGALGTGDYNSLAVERLDTGEVIGHEEYGLDLPGQPTGWVGTYIMSRHQGRRFGVEAKQLMFCLLFENFPLLKLYSDTVETHLGAARGLKLAGMRYEGRLSKWVVRGGSFVDSVLYGLRRAEWEAMPYRHQVRREAYWYGAPAPGAPNGQPQTSSPTPPVVAGGH
jgi:RimJ/RimL family protein N-acetyltransferase